MKSPDMRDEAVGLDCPAKAGRRRFPPLSVGGFPHLMVEGGVDFNGLEVAGVVFEPFRPGEVFWIKGASPVFVVPARCADEHTAHTSLAFLLVE